MIKMKTKNKIFHLIILCSVILLLSGCFTDKAKRTVKHTENALSITLSHNAKYVLIAHSQGHVELREVKSNKVISQWQHADTPGAGVIAADFSLKNAASDEFVVTAEQNNLALYSIK